MGTYSTNFNLYNPANGEVGWGKASGPAQVNQNWINIDSLALSKQPLADQIIVGNFNLIASGSMGSVNINAANPSNIGISISDYFGGFINAYVQAGSPEIDFISDDGTTNALYTVVGESFEDFVISGQYGVQFRAGSANSLRLPSSTGTTGQVLATDGGSPIQQLSWANGGVTNPAGPSGSIQFNANGVFGGIAGFLNAPFVTVNSYATASGSVPVGAGNGLPAGNYNVAIVLADPTRTYWSNIGYFSFDVPIGLDGTNEWEFEINSSVPVPPNAVSDIFVSFNSGPFQHIVSTYAGSGFNPQANAFIIGLVAVGFNGFAYDSFPLPTQNVGTLNYTSVVVDDLEVINNFSANGIFNSLAITSFGLEAGVGAFGGSGNVYVGVSAGNQDTGAGGANTFVGAGAAATNAGSWCTAIGYNAGEVNTGNYCVFIGGDSVYDKLAGDDCVFVGAGKGSGSFFGGTQKNIANSVVLGSQDTTQITNNGPTQLTNIICINGTATASNTTVIGNAATTVATIFGSLILNAGVTSSLASNATGIAGQLAYDANYLYICIASGTWKRIALTGGY